MVLGQALVAGSMVQGAKPCPWVKPARVWSEERNYGLWSNAGGGKCGPGSKTVPLGQAPPCPSVVRGEKLWSWVKRWWREVWSREPNCGFGSSTGGGKCGPGSQTAALGQARPRQSMVQGAKLRPWVTPCPTEVWFREQNRAPGSSPSECGLGSKTVHRVKPDPAKVWSREQNRAPGSPRPRQSMV